MKKIAPLVYVADRSQVARKPTPTPQPHHLSGTAVPMAAFFSFGSGIDVDVRLADEENRQFVEVKGDTGKGSKGDAFAGRERCPVYLDGEAVKGQVRSASLRPALQGVGATSTLRCQVGPRHPSAPLTASVTRWMHYTPATGTREGQRRQGSQARRHQSRVCWQYR